MKKDQGSSRTRWAAVGAAVAVAIGAGGGIAVTSAAVSSGSRAVFVPINPCRLLDTRTATLVGPRNTPLGAGETYTQQVTGSNGNCTIPSDATAVAMNMTVVDGTAGSFLTIWPSDAAKPLASVLNWQAGDAARPNKVDVRLSPEGRINFYNNGGTVNVIADVVGYYADHNHDDRYPQKVQVTFDLAAGGISSPISVPPNVPVSLTGVVSTSGVRGVGQATLLSAPGAFIEWTGLESTAFSGVTQGFGLTQGQHVLYVDFNHLVDVEIDSATTIRIHNESLLPVAGVVTLTW
ncbi:MAG TPA: hypothetical protein VHN36_10485 [Ilumatobacteraceae bacterium]|nr:hypothetical protein [Ilumatobacteraceae bacterium]